MGMADSKAIKIPETHYVGFQKRGETILGFMTPDGTDKAAIKRKETVDNWAKGHYYEKTTDLPAKTFTNEVLTGFRLVQEVRHGYGWGQGNVKWRVEDPRGFELEISSPNLANILGCTTIREGVIEEGCIWARFGTDNALVPVSSEAYKSAIQNTERLGKKVSAKDIRIGNRVVLKNGQEGIYLGQFYSITTGTGYNEQRTALLYDFVPSKSKKHYFVKYATDDSKQDIFSYSGLNISERYDGDMTHEAAEKLINEHLTSDGRISGEYGVKAVSIAPFDTPRLALRRIGIEAADFGHYRSPTVFAEDGSDFGFLKQEYERNWGNTSPRRYYTLDKTDRDNLITQGLATYPPHSSYRAKPEYHPSPSVRYYVLVGTIRTSTGIIIEHTF